MFLATSVTTSSFSRHETPPAVIPLLTRPGQLFRGKPGDSSQFLNTADKRISGLEETNAKTGVHRGVALSHCRSIARTDLHKLRTEQDPNYRVPRFTQLL